MRLINITKTYHNKNNDVQALSNINLSFSSEGMTFIVGESGCGKTTLLNIIASYDKDYEGILEKDGKVESIEQDIMLMENLSIFDNLLLVCDEKEIINKLLTKFKLKERNKKVKELSVGEKKRVQIIRSLLVQASYLICDEPTAALDYENGIHVMTMLKEISKDIGVIIVTHDIALVEQYSDRVIRMGKGCIIDDEPYIEKAHRINNIEEKRNIIRQMKLLIKMMASRWQETLFQFGLLFLTMLVLFVVTFLFPSLNSSMSATANWINSKNIIVTQPNEGNNIDRSNFAEDGSEIKANGFLYYDLYHKEDVYLVRDNIPGIIGYRLGWGGENEHYIGLAGTSYIPYTNIDGLRELIEKYQKNYEETGIKPFPQYEYCMNLLASYDDHFPNDEYIFSDFSNFVGFNDYFINASNMSFLTEEQLLFNQLYQVPNIVEEFVGGDVYHMDVIPYQLYPETNLDLIYGKMPMKENEILLTKSVASHLVNVDRLESLTDLIGHEIVFTFNVSCLGHIERNFIVSGITYMESRFENQVFLTDGSLDNIYAEIFDCQPDVVAYQYLNFLINPRKDGEAIASQLDRLLESYESHFEVYNVSAMADRELYQDPNSILIFTLFAFVTLLVLYIIMQILLNKRIRKENLILKRYHYHPLMMQIVRMMTLLIIVGILQIITLPYICDWLNHLANTIGIADIVVYSPCNYVISLIMAIFGVILLEGVIYAIRTKKY